MCCFSYAVAAHSGPALQNHFCQIGNCFLPESEKLKLDHCKYD